MPRPVILIHGSYHQPEHYAALAQVLRADTETVVVPDLGRMGLAEATADVQQIVDRCEQAPVVVAHSFGGATGGALNGLAQIIFLDGFVLERDETATTLLGMADDPREGEAFMAALRPSADGSTFSIDGAAAADLFFNGCYADAVRRGVELLRPELAANFGAAPVAAHWHQTPSLYLRMRDDRTWPRSLIPRLTSRCDETREIDGGHSSFVCRPDPIADVVRRSL